MAVDPGLGVFGQQRDVKLARGEHHLGIFAVDPVAIDIDVQKIVVEPDFLELAVGREQRARVPQPDIINGGRVLLERGPRERGCAVELPYVDAVEMVRHAGQRDVSLEVRLFNPQLVGLDVELFDYRLDQVEENRRAAKDDRRDYPQTEPALPEVGEADRSGYQRQRHQQPQARLP